MTQTDKIACLIPFEQDNTLKGRLASFKNIEYYHIDQLESKQQLLADLPNIDLLIFYDLIPIQTVNHQEQDTCIIVTWYRFLKYHYPKLKLLVIGSKGIYIQNSPKNYLDLVNEDFCQEKFDAVRPLSSYKITTQKNEKDETTYIENWIAADLLNGEKNINAILLQFFNGHNADSLLKHLTAIRQTMEIVYSELTSHHSDKLLYDELVEQWLDKYGKGEWTKLLSRWKNYRPYLAYLPFVGKLAELDKLMHELAMFFGEKFPANETAFLALQCHHKLNRIYTILECKIKPFVFIHEFYAKMNKDKAFN
jgi:hypothetical protein